MPENTLKIKRNYKIVISVTEAATAANTLGINFRNLFWV